MLLGSTMGMDQGEYLSCRLSFPRTRRNKACQIRKSTNREAPDQSRVWTRSPRVRHGHKFRYKLGYYVQFVPLHATSTVAYVYFIYMNFCRGSEKTALGPRSEIMGSIAWTYSRNSSGGLQTLSPSRGLVL